ncbi:MAG: nuclear transport factor 2 family protein [Bdellovibrionaceae bacterium]|nr:nuclear transport factor 2 family protein [Bdellovibrionales bacterium]MCB9254213.1 nuclear transport factor 2 family protein [Pseudobdellovibrionaceae bacterium]
MSIQQSIQFPFEPQELAEIRELWKKHSIAEDKRDIPGLLSTLTDDSVYEILETPHRWEGLAGAQRFYESLIGAIPDVHFDLQHIVIGPQGVFEEAIVTGVFKNDTLGFKAHGKAVRGVVGILFPWDAKKKLFKGERIYINLPAFLGG